MGNGLKAAKEIALRNMASQYLSSHPKGGTPHDFSEWASIGNESYAKHGLDLLRYSRDAIRRNGSYFPFPRHSKKSAFDEDGLPIGPAIRYLSEPNGNGTPEELLVKHNIAIKRNGRVQNNDRTKSYKIDSIMNGIKSYVIRSSRKRGVSIETYHRITRIPLKVLHDAFLELEKRNELVARDDIYFSSGTIAEEPVKRPQPQASRQNIRHVSHVRSVTRDRRSTHLDPLGRMLEHLYKGSMTTFGEMKTTFGLETDDIERHRQRGLIKKLGTGYYTIGEEGKIEHERRKSSKSDIP